MSVLPLLIQQVNKYVRKHVPSDKQYLLTLDGHGSRKGVEWVELCMKYKCEAVIHQPTPLTSYSPATRTLTKSFKKHIRMVRDEIMKRVVSDGKYIHMKLMCGVKAYKYITVEDCVISSCKTGLFPFQPEFAEIFKRVLIDLTSPDSDPGTTEKETIEQAKRILDMVENPSRALQRLTILLQNCKTTNSIFMGLRPASVVSTTNATLNVTLISGAPADT